jgi:hypothetical protein
VLSNASGASLRDSTGVGTIVNDDVPPRLSSFRLSPTTFRAAARGGSLGARTATGTTARFRLTQAATVTFRVQRAARGRLVGGRCVAPRPSNRGRRACVRYVTLRGSFSARGKAGANVLRFTGRLRNRRLAAGRYRLVAQAANSLGRSATRAVRFRIVR